MLEPTVDGRDLIFYYVFLLIFICLDVNTEEVTGVYARQRYGDGRDNRARQVCQKVALSIEERQGQRDEG